MKKLYFSKLGLFITFFLVLSFFLPGAIKGKFPIPADALINLYHPMRDISIDGYNPGKFPAKNTLITDPVLQTYPWRLAVANSLKSGNFPLWNQYSFSGQPLLGNIQSSTFQVTNLLLFILPFNIFWILQIILPEILLAIFTYCYLRFGLKLSVVPSVFGGFVMPFTGFFISWMTWGTIVTTAMWLPLIFLSIEKISKKSPLWLLILIFSLSQTIMSGHSQTALYVFGASFLYLIFKSSKNNKLEKKTLVIFAMVVSVMISAVQILPAIEFIKYSARSLDQSYFPGRQDWFLPIQNVAQIVAPDYFGNPATGNYWGIWNYGEFVSFVGIVPLFLAIYAMATKKKETLFFILMIVTSLVLALPNPISKIPYLLNLPLISSMQPSRAIFLLDFALVVLSAFGFEYLLKEKKIKKTFFIVLSIFSATLFLVLITVVAKNAFPKINSLNASQISLRNLTVPVLISALLFLIILLKKLTGKNFYWVLLIFSLSAFELFRFAYKFTPFSKLSWIFPETQTLSYLQKQKEPFRIITTDRRILHPNSSAAYGIESVDGYDPLYLLQYSKYISTLQSGNPQSEPSAFNRIITPQKFDSNLVNLLNVKFIITFDNLKNPGLVKVFQEGETKTYLNKKSAPRAFFVEEVLKETNDNQVLASILNPNFNPIEQAVSTDFAFPKKQTDANVQIRSYGSTKISLMTHSSTIAPLVLTNIFYPGWKAYVDGKETKIQKVDFIFQLVLVPPGNHVVEFKYLPQSFYNGLYLTVVGLVTGALGILFLYSLAKRHRASPE